MVRLVRTTSVTLVIPCILLLSSGILAQQKEPKAGQNLVKEVRHQLVLLPYYSVFDNLSYRVEGIKVTLSGQVVRPSLKSDAEAAVTAHATGSFVFIS
jgi:hyperosmotically inducible protein